MANIKNIRFFLSNKLYLELHEIFKISLSAKGDNFYLIKRNGELKISFHENGVKYLRINKGIKGEFECVLYKDQHYDAENLNPVFVYLPKELNTYPEFQKGEKWTSDIKISNEASNPDIAIKVYRVNYVNNGVYIDKKDKNISSIICEGYDLNDQYFKEENKISLLDFGQQKLYFHVCHVDRKNIDKTHDIILLFKPGTTLDLNSYIPSLKLPYNKNMDCQISQNKNDGTYFVSF